MVNTKLSLKKKQILLLLFAGATLLQISKNAQATTNQLPVEYCFESALLDNELGANVPEVDYTNQPTRSPKKQTTLIVYMAADNDLRNFATRNIKQMSSIGSSDYLNIVVHLDIRISGNKKVTRRYYIEKDRVLHMNAYEEDSQIMDSGDPATLISCCKWAIENYPANDYALVFWNHGAGIIDPDRGRIINPAELFSFNPTINKLELDRSIGFLDLVTIPQKNDEFPQDQRGICWDESTGNYLTNQKLEYALSEICTNYLGGKKLSIIGFDACLMAMLEVATIVQPYAEIMVSSQEVELGTGWNYAHVLQPFTQQPLNKYEFATHIVEMYEKTYKTITYDYTQSAYDLNLLPQLERNVHEIAQLLLDAIPSQANNTIKTTVREARKKNNCTHFDEPSYIDLHHFYTNLIAQIPNMALQNSKQEQEFKKSLKIALEAGLQLISDLVFANVCGKNLQLARGVSIYFPERKTHQSYSLTRFAKNNAWSTLIKQYTEPHRETGLSMIATLFE